MLRWLAFLLLVALPVAGQAATTFKNADFFLQLDSDWERLPLRFVEHVAFMSKSHNVSVKIDSAPAALRRHTAREAARGLLELGIKREHEENKGGSVTITNQSITNIPDGVRAEYAGRDSRQRSFRWVGFIQGKKFVYLYFETPTPREGQLESVVQSVLEGFRL